MTDPQIPDVPEWAPYTTEDKDMAEQAQNNMTVVEGGKAASIANSMTAAEIRAQVNLIQTVLRDVMKKGTHYDRIQGTQGDTLLKPGAEKVMMTFRLSADPEVEDLSTADEKRFRVVVRLQSPSGHFVGAGVGECSTNEEKYRWRQAVCDEEWEETPEDRRRKKWRTTRNGKSFSIKQIRTEPADLANTALKMAKKRGLIDAVLTATAASDIFTQDLEDLPPEYQAAVAGEQAAQKQTRSRVDGQDALTEGQLKLLKGRIANGEHGVTAENVCEKFGVESLEQIKKAQVNDVLAYIQNGGTE